MIELVIILLFVMVLLVSLKRPRNFPPGPTWLPIVGNNLQVKSLAKKHGGLHMALWELSKKYNTNVLGVKLGKELTVVVFTSPIIKSVLACDEYSARPKNFFFELRCLGSIRGLTCTDGELWTVQKTFLLKNLHNLGFGRKTIEENIHIEIYDIISSLRKNPRTQIRELIAPAVISILWSLMTGNRMSKNDVRINKLLNCFARRNQLFDVCGGCLAQYPWLRYIAPEWSGYNLIRKINEELKELFVKPIKQHYETWTEGEDSDLIYSFITEMNKEYPHYSFTDDQLLMVCLDLFIAGAGATSVTMDFAFYMMLKHPNIQEKAQKVIDQEYHKDDIVSYADRNKLPYVEAILLEVGRLCSITPLVGPRRTLKDTVIEGYSIPKDSTILLHTYAICMSPELFEHPEEFNPERFLTADGNVIHNNETMTFGFGKRKCLGESLAKVLVFTFFTEVLRHYSIVNNSENCSNTIVGNGIFPYPKYSAMFIKRK